MVYLCVTLSVMVLDMRELSRVLERRNIPVKMSEPPMNVRVARSDIPDVRLEMLHINNIEPHNSCEYPDIRLCNILAKIVGAFSLTQMLLYSVEALEELCDGLLIGFLGSGESGSVDAIVDVGVDPFVRCFDFCLKIFREEGDISVFLVDYVVELFGLEVSFLLH